MRKLVPWKILSYKPPVSMVAIAHKQGHEYLDINIYFCCDNKSFLSKYLKLDIFGLELETSVLISLHFSFRAWFVTKASQI